MESIRQYSDSDEDPEQHLELAGNGACASQLPLPPKPGIFHGNSVYQLESDYFGLNSSEEEEEEVSGIRDQTALPIDTLINSYQLRNEPVGPKREVLEPEEAPKRKYLKSAKSLGECGRVTEAQCSSLTSSRNDGRQLQNAVLSERPNLAFFQPNVRVSDGLDGPPRTSRLPKGRLRRFKRHSGAVLTLQWAPPKNSHLLLSSSMDGSVKIWDVFAANSWMVWTRNSHRAAVTCAQWSLDGFSVLSGGYDKTARLYDVCKDLETAVYRHEHFVQCLKFHPDVSNVFLTGSFGQIECWDVRDDGAKPVKTFRANFDEVQDIEFLLSGDQVLSCANLVSRDSTDRAIMCWDFRTGTILSNQIFHERYHCTCLRVHPSGRHFVAQTNGNYVALFSTTRPYKHDKFKRYEGHKVEGYKIGCSFSTSDGRFLYSGSSDGQMYVYDFKTSFLIRNYHISGNPVLSVESHPVLPSAVAVSDWNGYIFFCE